MLSDGVYFSWRRLWNFQAPWSAIYSDTVVGDAWSKRSAKSKLSAYEHRP